MEIDWKIVCTGIAAVTVLECFALHKGFNGVLLTAVIGAILLAIGVSLPQWPKKA